MDHVASVSKVTFDVNDKDRDNNVHVTAEFTLDNGDLIFVSTKDAVHREYKNFYLYVGITYIDRLTFYTTRTILSKIVWSRNKIKAYYN